MLDNIESKRQLESLTLGLQELSFITDLLLIFIQMFQRISKVATFLNDHVLVEQELAVLVVVSSLLQRNKRWFRFTSSSFGSLVNSQFNSLISEKLDKFKSRKKVNCLIGFDFGFLSLTLLYKACITWPTTSLFIPCNPKIMTITEIKKRNRQILTC